jgi:hypothetical protein
VAATGNNYFQEKYKIVVSTTGNEEADFTEGTLVFEETLTSEERSWGFAKREIDLTVFEGSEVHIAFVHYDCTEQDRLIIREVAVAETAPPARQLPFADDFESYEDTDDFLANSGWQTIDGDGDGRNWALLYDDVDDIRVMESESYGGGGALTPENYLITPALAMPALAEGESIMLNYHVAATGNSYYQEKYKVVVSADGGMLEDFAEATVVFEETLTEAERSWRFALREVDLSAFAGSEVYIAIVHYDCTEQDRLIVNDFKVEVLVDESHDLPFTENFEVHEDTDAFLAATGWTTIDADGDELNWFLDERDGNQFMASQSYASGAVEPDNYLVTPIIRLPAEQDNAFIILSYDVAATGNNFFAENYKVMVSTTGNEVEDFTEESIVFEETLTENERGRQFSRRHVDLAAYAGEAVYIAFVHADCTDQDMLILDNVALRIVNSATIAPEMASFNPMAPEDVSTTIFWFGATEVTGISDGTNELVAGTDYTVEPLDDDKATLTFLPAYLENVAEGLLQMTIQFNTGNPAVFSIEVAGTPENATIAPGMVDFDPQAPANVVALITWGDATSVTTVAVNGETIATSNYGVVGNQLTILPAFFEGKEPGYLFFAATFDVGENASFVVRVVDHAVRTLPFAEDFMGLPELGADTPEEWLPNGWSAIDANQDGQNWYWVPVNVDGAFSYGRMQSRSAVQVDGVWQALTPDNWLITPPIKLNPITAAGQSIDLTFRVAPGASTPAFRLEQYSVLVSYTDMEPASFDLLYNETISEDHPQNSLLERTVELSFYESQDVYIAFRHFGSTDKDRLLFSNVKVTFVGDNTSVEDPSLSQIKAYPNPVRDWLTIESGVNIKQIEMVGMLGNIVYRQDVHDTRTQFNVSDIPEGIYFLRALTDNGMVVHRVQVIR